MDDKKLEEENKMLREKLEQIKNYKKNYYQDKFKHNKFYCAICDKEVSAGSKANHLKGVKHRRNNAEKFKTDFTLLAQSYGMTLIEVGNKKDLYDDLSDLSESDEN